MSNDKNALPRVERQRNLGALPKRKNIGEKGRNPYDGLRPWSAITHGVGAILAVAGTLLLMLQCIHLNLDVWHWASFLLYGCSMICLYTASTLYHCLRTGVRGRINLRKLDHVSIYFLIAGSYAPICLVVLRRVGAWGWGLFGAIWGLALLGLILTLIWITAPRWLTAGIYIFMGWLGMIALVPMASVFPVSGFFWLLCGGVLYTLGGVLYAVKWPGRNNPCFGCHEIFHVFIVLGSFCHFMMFFRVISFL